LLRQRFGELPERAWLRKRFGDTVSWIAKQSVLLPHAINLTIRQHLHELSRTVRAIFRRIVTKSRKSYAPRPGMFDACKPAPARTTPFPVAILAY
jgi:hypothetical protein